MHLDWGKKHTLSRYLLYSNRVELVVDVNDGIRVLQVTLDILLMSDAPIIETIAYLRRQRLQQALFRGCILIFSLRIAEISCS